MKGPLKCVPPPPRKFLIVRFSIVLVVFLLVFPSLTVSAATIKVKNKCSLQQAIKSANQDKAFGKCTAGNGADTISLSKSFILKKKLPVITSNITIHGNGYMIATNHDHRYFSIKGGKVHLDNLYLDRGRSPNGGLIRIDGGEMTITNSKLRGGWADKNGGAIWMKNSTVTIDNSKLDGSWAYKNGGGIWAKGGKLTITNSTLYANVARDKGVGGAIFQNGTKLTLNNVTIHHNSAFKGGGIFHDGKNNLSLNNVTFAYNRAKKKGKGNDIWPEQ